MARASLLWPGTLVTLTALALSTAPVRALPQAATPPAIPAPPAPVVEPVMDRDQAREETVLKLSLAARNMIGPDFADQEKVLRDVASIARVDAGILHLKRFISTVQEPWREAAVAALARADAAFATERLETVDIELASLGSLRRPWSTASGYAWANAIEIRAQIADLRDLHDTAEEMRLSAARDGRLSIATRWFIVNSAAQARYAQGRDNRDKVAVKRAIVLYCTEAFPMAPRNRRPGDRAVSQSGLADSLSELETLESGMGHLDEAVRHYRQALEDYRRSRAKPTLSLPIEIQQNIGHALERIGRRDHDTQRLKEATAAYRLALGERARFGAEYNWVEIETDIARSLYKTGRLGGDAEYLAQAVTAYRTALGDIDRAKKPLLWAQTEQRIGDALIQLGMREHVADHLEEAVGAYDQALVVLRNYPTADYAYAAAMRLLAKTLVAERNGSADLLAAAGREREASCTPTLIAASPDAAKACRLIARHFTDAPATPPSLRQPDKAAAP